MTLLLGMPARLALKMRHFHACSQVGATDLAWQEDQTIATAIAARDAAAAEAAMTAHLGQPRTHPKFGLRLSGQGPTRGARGPADAGRGSLLYRHHAGECTRWHEGGALPGRAG
ncbi:hypothetical protein [Streptomyces anulatus]|uniref:hypothetical protein n=1 Tax=Streptomyces anulatus TaxID=1892 RepID=UPI0037246B1F